MRQLITFLFSINNNNLKAGNPALNQYKEKIMYQLFFTVNDKELRRLKRVAKHLDYDSVEEMMGTITNRLVNARCSRDGLTYFAEGKR